MKKFTSKLLLVMMVLTMAFGLAACGSEKNDSKTNNSQGSVSNTNNQTSSKNQDEAKKAYASVEDYVSSDEVQAVLSEVEGTLSGTGMGIAIKADGDKMIYSYKYDSIKKADLTDEQIAALETSVEAESDTFQDTADELKKLVDADSPSVVLEYVDANNEVIYSKEFVAQ